jgi:hypothetical protein
MIVPLCKFKVSINNNYFGKNKPLKELCHELFDDKANSTTNIVNEKHNKLFHDKANSITNIVNAKHNHPFNL